GQLRPDPARRLDLRVGRQSAEEPAGERPDLPHPAMSWNRILVFVTLTTLWLPRAGSAAVTAIWANSGDEKVTQDELRATTKPATTLSKVWDGKAIHIFGARNEVVSFNLILESADGASNV